MNMVEQVTSDLERLKASRESLVQDLQELLKQQGELRKAIDAQDGGIAYATYLLQTIEARESEMNGVEVNVP